MRSMENCSAIILRYKSMVFRHSNRERVLNKELSLIANQEEKLAAAAQKSSSASWKAELEKKIPDKVYSGLQSAFCKGFSLVFDQGRAIIEKSYDKEKILADQSIRDYAVQVKGGRKEIKRIHKSARRSELLNLSMTTVEGLGLGALGIGMPDIILFISTLLRGIYETALNYGFDYQQRREQLLILKMMAAALSGDQWESLNREVDDLMSGSGEVSEEAFQTQLQETASVFAMDMLLLKFVQGLPVVGILGGAANPVYYRKVMQYVQLKYKKRYLLNLR